MNNSHSAGAALSASASDDGGDSGLKRRSSWRRFKESVKETVQGWVSSGSTESVSPSPSPGHNMHRASSPAFAFPEDAARTFRASAAKRASVPHIPKIVVTCDELPKPARPPRRASTTKIKISLSSSNVPGESDRPQSEPGRVTFDDSALHMSDEEKEVKKRMAVMKIKQALAVASVSSDDVFPFPKDDGFRFPKEDLRPASSASAASASPQIQTRRLSTASPAPPSSPLRDRRHSDTAATITKTLPTSEHFQMQSEPPPQPQLQLNMHIPEQLPISLAVASANVQQRRKSTSDFQVAGGNGPARAPSMKSGKAGGPAAAKRPMIWDHFDVLPNNSTQGKCKTCRMNLSCKYNTGNFVRHLQLAHKDVYRQYQNKIESEWTQSMLVRNLK
jgi:hypothetical protein